MEVELVKAQVSDKKFLLSLRKRTMVEHLQKANMPLSDAQHIASVNELYECAYIVMHSDQQIGLLKYQETKDTIEIVQLQILPSFQGKGIGKYLLNLLASKAQPAKKTLTLKVLKENPAKHLYERFGFEVVGEDQYEYHMKCILIK